MSSAFEVRVRLSFPGETRALAETAAIMEAFARSAARVLAPELSWSAETTAHDEHADDARWASTHVVRLLGRDSEGTQRGRGEVHLSAGGDASRVGGNGLIELETVRPARFLLADNHCDVTHWDLVASPLDEDTFSGVQSALERAVGRPAERGGERREPFTPSAQLLAEGASAEDAALWIEDLGSVGLRSRGHAARPDALAVLVESADLEDILDLEDARTTLGEVLGEAGHEDWYERARSLLARLPGVP